MKKTRLLRYLSLLLVAMVLLSGCVRPEAVVQQPAPAVTEAAAISEDGSYSSKEEVAEYLYTFGHLPSNYLTKKEAQELGWVSSQGNLWKVAPGMSIGGDRFYNKEKILPPGTYYECDIDTVGAKSRGSKRIVFSKDGTVYYTYNHYKSFVKLYGPR